MIWQYYIHPLYDFLVFDAESGEYYYDDTFIFSSDLSAGNEFGREELWERNLENLKGGTLGDPSEPSTLLRYWQSQERAHYPGARDNVEYFLDITLKGGGGFCYEQPREAVEI